MSIKIGGIVASNVCGEGNKMFPLFTALIYGHKHNLFLHPLRRGNRRAGDRYTAEESQIHCVKIDYALFNKNKKYNKNLVKKKLNHANFNKEDELRFYGNKLYIFNDFFQNANYLNKNYHIIMKYVKTKEIIKPVIYNSIHNNDILCILRMGEMINLELVTPEYYLSIFKKHEFNNIYFLVYPYNINFINKYLSYFEEYKDKIILLKNENKLVDFYCVNYFNYIATSISTFNWWSIFFIENSNKIIYTPKYLGYLRNPPCHRNHCKNLKNIRNITIPVEHKFFDRGAFKKLI
ncbi:hypothetical protein OAI84_00180 [bacterium]|nr:hypothetical protein [bacterium]